MQNLETQGLAGAHWVGADDQVDATDILAAKGRRIAANAICLEMATWAVRHKDSKYIRRPVMDGQRKPTGFDCK